MIRTRATHKEQKENRRQAILKTARAMFLARGYEAITVTRLAQNAGLAKGTIYLYFKTKEEIFLTLTRTHLNAWFQDITARLTGPNLLPSVEEVALAMTQSITAQPGLTRFLAILATVFEQNVDRETALGFKRFLAENLAHFGKILESRVPNIPTGQGARFLLRVHALVVGLHHLSYPSPVMADIMRDPEIQVFQIDFESELTATLVTLLRGYEEKT